MSLIVDKELTVALRDCQRFSHLECTTVSLWGLLLAYFFWDVPPQAEQPPTFESDSNRTRLDVVLKYLRDQNDWEFTTAAHIEYKKPDATPDDLRLCEAQLQNGASTLFSKIGSGELFSLSIYGCFCRVFKYTKTQGGPLMQVALTGEGGSSLDRDRDYMDITDEDEGELINSILRDIRESMGLDRDGIHPELVDIFGVPSKATDVLQQIANARKNGCEWSEQYKRRYTTDANGNFLAYV